MGEFMSLRALATVVVTTVMMLPHAWADTVWESYKSRFMMPDGRIVDTGNGNVSHTEGQGFAMLLAVANDDRPAFDKLWQWTDKTRWRPIQWRIKMTPPMAIP